MNPFDIPSNLEFLFTQKARYKVLYGGRGSGKSWNVARSLLMIGISRPIRVLCAREIQKSIRQSVHQLLSDQIELLGVEDEYTVLRDEIRGNNGTEFYFSGLSDQTVDSLKSFEGVDYCWIEEAQSITRNSYKILIPTIRKSGSEIWITFNPQLESDETYQRFVINTPPDSIVKKVNYGQNPWFNKSTMPQEMVHDKSIMSSEEFNHIWLGQCMPAVEGAIYFKQMTYMEQGNRIKDIPHDPMLKTHVVLDLGFNDATAIILCQVVAGEFRVIHYVEGRQRTLSEYNTELRNLRFFGAEPNWGDMYMPHDAFAKRHQTGITDASIMQQLGWVVQKVPNQSIRSGIDRGQELFRTAYIDSKAERLIECLKRYRWNINEKTGEGKTPLHDEFSHGADAWRYAALCVDKMSNEDGWGDLSYNTGYVV